MRTYFVLFSFALAACGSSKTGDSAPSGGCTASNATATSQITIANYVISPSCLKVTRSGGSAALTITNNDSVAHDIASQGGKPAAFDSGNLDPSGTPYNGSLTTAGTYSLYCTYHSSMAPVTLIVE